MNIHAHIVALAELTFEPPDTFSNAPLTDFPVAAHELSAEY